MWHRIWILNLMSFHSDRRRTFFDILFRFCFSTLRVFRLKWWSAKQSQFWRRQMMSMDPAACQQTNLFVNSQQMNSWKWFIDANYSKHFLFQKCVAQGFRSVTHFVQHPRSTSTRFCATICEHQHAQETFGGLCFLLLIKLICSLHHRRPRTGRTWTSNNSNEY